ncbi:electron transfer flavoprotein subunit alpha/FixB family protein [Rhodovibrio salinarum]|uniref:Electron transfer flavoprotein subunit alpha/FixB family protein n=1 Tax=Rhodovibrio salinarum TaxID=1087 RepID=A0A934QM15_9PROT|nr:electron transfer flavoprotein subunit alpha/FixB family protein [Rhodovibrio salinarum]MBK1698990.1 electron transfer flavoprotein subunit alpha/FixB family protein [Rhodovibrio salinarum]
MTEVTNQRAGSRTAAANAAGKGVRRGQELPEVLKAYAGVWVFVEQEHGRVHPVSWELLSEGRKLADSLGTDLTAVVLGPADHASETTAAEAFHYGADTVRLATDPVLAQYRTEPYTSALCALIDAYTPEILLLGATVLGRDLAGAVATRLGTGLTADCTELAIDQGRALAATRPTFGGSLLCTIQTLSARPQMATVRPRVMKMAAPDRARSGPVIREAVDLSEQDVITKVLDFVRDDITAQAQLAYADIVVAGGLGLQHPDNIQLVIDLAQTLGGDYGCSRPLIQKGWMAADRQIGQTGKTIRPRLYIAAGISGAVQHRVGCEGADMILAINNDEAAPIFDFAHYGLVGNCLELLPALTRAFARQLQSDPRVAVPDAAHL